MPTQTQSIAQQHATWLSLMEISGPFLSTPVLEEFFPYGLDKRENESEVRRRVSLAYEEWLNNQSGMRPDPAIHQQWLRFVLEEVLEIAPQALLSGQEIPATLRSALPEYHETLRPQLVVRSPYEPEPRLLVQLYPRTQDLNKVVAEQRWKASPATRMAELLRHSGTRLGLVTNGRHWMLVDAPRDETTGYYTWDASLWTEEELTLRAFRTLLGMERFFTVPDSERLEALLAKSAQKQEEVTSQLGDQVRRAVETLVYTLDRLDKDSQRALLENIAEKELYEAALTVMMRLVFLLSAEEREMLLLGEALYEENYAISTIHNQLQEQADQQGEEVLGLRYDAWSRLLATFRVVYSGVEHVRMRLPAYGGDLFNPDRYPFLEGRKAGTSWRETPAEPLLIDNRTVLHLLRALQFLHVRIGGLTEARRLSFRALDIEQIGHVYEGLLDHTARRSHRTILGLLGSKDGEPEATLDELEKARNKGERVLIKLLVEISGRGESSVQKNLAQGLDTPLERSRLMEACDNNQALFERVLPFAGLLRKDTFGNFLLVTPGSIYVTHGTDRRSTGTHYTPRSLTEPLVQHALDPLVYLGPAEGLPREEWQLRGASDILNLKICDLAMGSGAVLVQACRYLSEKLVEAWDTIERASMNGEIQHGQDRRGQAASLHSQGSDDAVNVAPALAPGVVPSDTNTPTLHLPRIAPTGQPSRARQSEELLSRDIDERLATARRIVAERCLYGVDKNPMAVEMARLSLWLITLAKNKPFTFLDSNLRCGDSLLGVNLQQLQSLAMDAKDVRQMSFMEQAMERAIALAMNKRREISMRLEQSAADADEKARKLSSANDAMQLLKLGGDLLIAIALAEPKHRADLRNSLLYDYELLITTAEDARVHPLAAEKLREHQQNIEKLRAAANDLLRDRTPFHWPLEFPEVFAGGGAEAGFAAVVGNPPFMGGNKITAPFGTDYRDFLVDYIAGGKRGSADLCAYFFLQVITLLYTDGMSALLATNTIAQGDTREIGLDQITAAGRTIPRATSNKKWPGEAGVQVAEVWLRKGHWAGISILDEVPVKDITSFLTASNLAQGYTYVLATNAQKSFRGSELQGMGFTLPIEDAQDLLQQNSRNKQVLFPFLNAEDLNSRPDQSPSRWVINFREWPVEQAKTFVECFQVVQNAVKPERDSSNDKKLQGSWWIYKRPTTMLYETIAQKKRVLIVPLLSKYMLCSWGPGDIVYSHALGIIAIDIDSAFALIQCTFHGDWARKQGSTMRNDQRYTLSDCFETFPFPYNTDRLESIGERYYTHRQSIMLTRQEGLTKTYNRFHNPGEQSADIVQLRELHKEMDEAVARAYGWEDLRLEHSFHETKQGLRYTISETARREVLDRLLLLNHERHAEEVAAGLVDENGKPLKGKAKGAKGNASKARV
ncbi:MAG TPA: DNA methyltransferase, partial [Ktedonobacteraceae bacterium]|nr:DNA methyltransferase [Ktedonobacteraceae bacterium]